MRKPRLRRSIELAQGEYEAIRQVPTHFFVLPDHAFHEVETIEAPTSWSRNSALVDAWSKRSTPNPNDPNASSFSTPPVESLPRAGRRWSERR
jgi:hypothetical protein